MKSRFYLVFQKPVIALFQTVAHIVTDAMIFLRVKTACSSCPTCLFNSNRYICVIDSKPVNQTFRESSPVIIRFYVADNRKFTNSGFQSVFCFCFYCTTIRNFPQPGFITIYHRFFPFLIGHAGWNIIGLPILPPGGPLADKVKFISEMRDGCGSAPHMKRWSSDSRFKVLHGEHLTIHLPAYV